MRPCAVEALAARHGIPTYSPRSLRRPEVVTEFAAHGLDLLIVVAYGLILPPPILVAPRLGCVNVHASLLPRWRGAAPIERAIMAGDRTTGVSVMQMEEGLDTGPVLRQVSCPITDTDTGDTLHERLAELGAETLLHCLANWQMLIPEPQPESGITYATKLTNDDSLIDWTRDPGYVSRQIRALNSRMPAFTWLGTERVRLWFARPAVGGQSGKPGEILAFSRQALTVACGDGAIEVMRAQVARGKGLPLDAATLFNGFSGMFRTGRRFTDRPDDDGNPARGA